MNILLVFAMFNYHLPPISITRQLKKFIVGLSNCDDVLPIYVGDDRTDEDAFKVCINFPSYSLDGFFLLIILPSKTSNLDIHQVLRENNRGYGILVSSVPKESNAFYSLRDPSEVLVYLEAINLGSNCCCIMN